MGGLALRLRSALGLRGRIVGVVLVTTVGTLAIAAVALLGPLENSLRKTELHTLRHNLGRDPARPFRRLPLGNIVYDPSGTGDAAALLQRQQTLLENRIGGGIVVVLGNAGTDGRGSTPLINSATGAASAGVAGDTGDAFSDAPRAFTTGRTHYSFGSIDGTEYARAAIPFTRTYRLGQNRLRVRYVLAVRKSIAEIPAVIRVVRRAFIDAALAGLALTLILGIPLSGRLVRRLQRLRQAAMEVEHDAPEAVVPLDTANDEVGSLARSLAAMQHRLRHQEQARRSFVATASHELRTPLTSLDGMLELLDEDMRDPGLDLDDARELLGRARAQSRRLGRLAADLLDLSRLDAQVELRSEPVELAELSRAVLAEFELANAERGIHSGLDDLGGAVWALGDPGSIARILRILLDNAQRVSSPGSEIRVVLRRDADASISVCDQGPGVPEEERETIFHRFNRGRDTGGQAGFGLGLAIGRELARRMGGDLALEPASGVGATFTLQLPAARAPEHENERVPVG